MYAGIGAEPLRKYQGERKRIYVRYDGHFAAIRWIQRGILGIC